MAVHVYDCKNVRIFEVQFECYQVRLGLLKNGLLVSGSLAFGKGG
jgi:hypothetical protein